MLFNLIYSESIKYKRTMLPLIIAAGGFFPAATGLLIVSSHYSQGSWKLLIGEGISLANMLALLLTAVFTGYVFINEYHEGTVSILFTYPVTRFKLYAVKHFIILIMDILLYASFFILLILLGFFYLKTFPSAQMLYKLIKAIVLIICVNYVLVPVTTVICIMIKETGAYILCGMAYVIASVSITNLKCSMYFPMCMTNKIAQNYLIKECITSSDFSKMIIISVLIFISAFTIGAICYLKSDIYKTE